MLCSGRLNEGFPYSGGGDFLLEYLFGFYGEVK